MAFNNQGSRPNYQSSILPLKYQAKPYENVFTIGMRGAGEFPRFALRR